MQQQQQQQQQRSDNYAGAPEMLSFGGGNEQAEAASPISSRPPASNINFDELVDHDIQQGGGGSGNRWPRQETLALLKIRSDMDVAFRDATLKAPLWDEVSRKLGELGYVRSAKKCKEKFENVHKYYKRTKEGRAGRQDGKTYRFFTQLEAMQGQPPPTTTGSLNLVQHQQAGVMSSGPASSTFASGSTGSIQFATPVSVAAGGGTTSGVMRSGGGLVQPFAMYSTTNAGIVSALPGSVAPPQAPAGISFSSDSASSDSDDEVEDYMMSDEEEEEEEEELGEDRPASSNQKRKRSGGSKAGNKRSKMMNFFEGLMKQVMKKQEAMQQKFLETIEKREQDRLMREEAWKQHEAARLSREGQLAAQERAMAASRDAAIVSFLQKITGQTIQLPPQPQPQPRPVFTQISTPIRHAPSTPASAPIPSRQQQVIRNQMPPPAVPTSNNEAIMAVPERQIPPNLVGQESSSSEPASSSRWPKAEVLALIKLRSSLENRYTEAGPKGPLWEEISLSMQRMGYNRSSKRCKEKWENINKYFKKVKESNKKRPEDAKTCPYFNELDALYQRKKLGISASSSTMVQFQQEQQADHKVQETSATQVEPILEMADGSDDQVHRKHGGSPEDNIIGFQESNISGGARKPEDIMMEQKQFDMDEECNQQKINDICNNSADDEDDEDDSDVERKMGNKIDEFQRPTTNNKNGGTTSSFNITMVQ